MTDLQTECVICLENISDDYIIFPCKHSLHAPCFSLYAQHKVQDGQSSILCPLCQKQILQIECEVMQPVNTDTNINTNTCNHSICVAITNVLLTLGASALFFYIISNFHNSD